MCTGAFRLRLDLCVEWGSLFGVGVYGIKEANNKSNEEEKLVTFNGLLLQSFSPIHSLPPILPYSLLPSLCRAKGEYFRTSHLSMTFLSSAKRQPPIVLMRPSSSLFATNTKSAWRVVRLQLQFYIAALLHCSRNAW